MPLLLYRGTPMRAESASNTVSKHDWSSDGDDECTGGGGDDECTGGGGTSLNHV